MPGTLSFRRLSAPGTTAPLTFYGDLVPSGTGALDGVVLLGGLEAVHPDGFATLDGIVYQRADFTGLFDLNVPDGPKASLQAPVPESAPVAVRSGMDWARPRKLSVSPAASINQGATVASGLEAGLGTIPRKLASMAFQTDSIPSVRKQSGFAFASRLARASCASDLTLQGVESVAAWMALAFIRHPSKSGHRVLPWPLPLAEIGLVMTASSGSGRRISREWIIPLRHGVRLGMGKRPAIPTPPPPETWPNPNRLSFVAPWQPGNRLIFNRDGHLSRSIIIRRVYVVSNTFALYRLSDGLSLPAESLELKTDDPSWCWSMSGGLADLASADQLVPGGDGPVIVRAHVNGTDWDFVIDDPEGDEAWDSSSSSIHGRSRTALFDEPYYPALEFGNAEQRLFSQVANDLFYYNGASLGVDVAVGVEDWLIPAGLWSFMGTPIAALKRLAAAPDAVLSSATAGLGFSITPRYPVLPWNWADATPWATIPRGYWAGRRRRWETKPNHDLVIVAGDTADGVLLPVQRDGTGGLWRAPDQIDRLMCAATAARQRGQSILADAGRQSYETITMPIGSEFGLVPKGALLELQDTVTWRGLVRSVAVSVRLEGEAMDVMQTLEVERHHG